jgi:LPXTG-motif cell wall-anchored protein
MKYLENNSPSPVRPAPKTGKGTIAFSFLMIALISLVTYGALQII